MKATKKFQVILLSGCMMMFAAISCSKDGSGGKGPSIDKITPSSVLTGDQIVITGKNLEEASVLIGGIAVEAEDNTSTSLTTRVPAGASVGSQVVEVSNAKGTAKGNITVTGAGAPPVITSIAPANVARGGTITITGTGFAAGVGVRIATINATVTSSTATSIVVVIPSTGIADGSAAVQVLTPLGVTTSTVNIIP